MAAAKETTNPLTCQPMRENSIVEVKSNGGAIFKFKVIEVSDDSLVLQKPSSKLAVASGNSVQLNLKMVIGKYGIHTGERVFIKFKNGAWKRRFKKGPLLPVYRSQVGHQHRFKKGLLLSCRG